MPCPSRRKIRRWDSLQRRRLASAEGEPDAAASSSLEIPDALPTSPL